MIGLLEPEVGKIYCGPHTLLVFSWSDSNRTCAFCESPREDFKTDVSRVYFTAVHSQNRLEEGLPEK